MTLLELRTMFAQRSGRYDLVTSLYANSGADWFIQAGQRFLERRLNDQRELARVWKKPSAGTIAVTFTQSRSIREVWALGTSSRTLVELQPLRLLRETYASKISEIDQGLPLYWAPTVIRTVPEMSATPPAEITNVSSFIEIPFTPNLSSNGIAFYPPSDGSYTLELWGQFAHSPLSVDGDTNYWTENFPEALLIAALYELEVFYRNTEGAKDWLFALDEHLRGIERDVVEQEVVDMTQMRG